MSSIREDHMIKEARDILGDDSITIGNYVDDMNYSKTRQLITNLQKEFELTDFGPILALLHGASYHKSTHCQYTTENNYDKASSMEINLMYTYGWDNSSTWEEGVFYIYWNTSSNHDMVIIGYIDGGTAPHGQNKYCCEVQIGTDPSEGFYSIIKDIMANTKLPPSDKINPDC